MRIHGTDGLRPPHRREWFRALAKRCDGLGPRAGRLRSRRSEVRIFCGAPINSRVSSDDAEAHDKVVTTARALLEAVADGAPDALERARDLAEADIEERGGRLALQVLSGDAFALARAVELARVVLDRVTTNARRMGARPCCSRIWSARSSDSSVSATAQKSKGPGWIGSTATWAAIAALYEAAFSQRRGNTTARDLECHRPIGLFTAARLSSKEPSWRAALQSNALAWRSMSTTSVRPPSRVARD